MSAWPYAGDSITDIARKIAIAYRTHLHAASPSACDVLDEVMRHYAQLWLLPDTQALAPTDELTTSQAAARAGVSATRIRAWACQRHPVREGEAKLPRFGWRGRERTYLAVHLDEAKTIYDATRGLQAT